MRLVTCRMSLRVITAGAPPPSISQESMGIGLVPKWVPLSSLCDPLFICSSARWDGHGGGVDFGWRPSSQGPCLVALGRHHDFRLTFIVGSRSLCCLLPSQRLRWGGKRWLHSVYWLPQPELCLGSGVDKGRGSLASHLFILFPLVTVPLALPKPRMVDTLLRR